MCASTWRSRLVWSRAHDWKSCNRQKRFEGSNPSSSASKIPLFRVGFSIAWAQGFSPEADASCSAAIFLLAQHSLINGTTTKIPHIFLFPSHPRYSVALRAPYESLHTMRSKTLSPLCPTKCPHFLPAESYFAWTSRCGTLPGPRFLRTSLRHCMSRRDITIKKGRTIRPPVLCTQRGSSIVVVGERDELLVLVRFVELFLHFGDLLFAEVVDEHE